MDQGKELIRLALFGEPISASLSPSIHRMFADQFGLKVDYQLIETGAAGFPQALKDFRLAGGSGCNITLPLKREAWQLAESASEAVSQAQAANTLVYQPASGWFAHTTDGPGLMADLTGNHGIELFDRRILILGTGGATAGILADLLAAKPRQVVMVNRDLDRARGLRQRFGSLASVVVIPWSDLPGYGNFDLVINATSLGHLGQAPPLLPSLFGREALCYDLNYFKAGLALKVRCDEMRQPYIDGLGMLVEQAAMSFCIWTGKQPETRVVIDAIKSGVS